jgi:hypothetical protein
MLCHVVLYAGTGISEVSVAFVFMAFRGRHQILPNHQHLSIKLHGITLQKTVILMHTTKEISNLRLNKSGHTQVPHQERSALSRNV